MIATSFSDKNLKDMFLAGGKRRDDAWKFIYHNWRPQYMINIKKKGGNDDQVDEIFSDVAINFENRVLNNDLLEVENFQGYFTKCMYFAWLNFIKAKNIHIEISDDLNIHDNEPNQLMSAEYTELAEAVDQLISLLNQRCKDILKLFSQGFSMKEISQKLDLKDEIKAKKEKYECQNKIKLFLKSNPKLENQIKQMWYAG